MISIDKFDIPSKLQLTQLTLMEINEFVDNNNLDFDMRKIEIKDINHKKMYGCFFPYTMHIEIYIRGLQVPAAIPNFNIIPRKCSWPGFFIDATPVGIIAHEFGHWINEYKEIKTKHIRNRIDGELPINNLRHFKSVSEQFAESFRIFLLNPAMLREGRPCRWKLFRNYLGLKPNHRKHWDTVLGKADPAYITLTNKWIYGEK